MVKKKLNSLSFRLHRKRGGEWMNETSNKGPQIIATSKYVVYFYYINAHFRTRMSANLSSYKIKHNANDLNSDIPHTFPLWIIIQNPFVTNIAYYFDIHSPSSTNQLPALYLSLGHWFEWVNICEIFSGSLGRTGWLPFTLFPIVLNTFLYVGSHTGIILCSWVSFLNWTTNALRAGSMAHSLFLLCLTQCLVHMLVE